MRLLPGGIGCAEIAEINGVQQKSSEAEVL